MPTGNVIESTLWVFLSVASFLFGAWPLVIFSLVRPKGNVIAALMAGWCLLAIARVATLFIAPENQLQGFVLQEPLNTQVFVACGAILTALFLIQRALQPRLLARKFRHVKLLDDFRQLSPTQFELACAVLYQSAGHRVKHLGRRGDHGVDLLVKSKTGEKWVVQCKRWNYPVGEKEVRDLAGAMSHFKADKAFLITTSTFTSPAMKWSKGKPVSLLDGSRLAEMWIRMQASQQKQIATAAEPKRTHTAP